jgi:hypothetical protein
MNLFKLTIAIFLTCLLSACMSITITAREGSTVTVTQDKPVSVPTNATIPMSALP